MVIDIRDSEQSETDEIKYADRDSISCDGFNLIFRECGREKYHISVKDIDNLVKALEKAKEVWL